MSSPQPLPAWGDLGLLRARTGAAGDLLKNTSAQGEKASAAKTCRSGPGVFTVLPAASGTVSSQTVPLPSTALLRGGPSRSARCGFASARSVEPPKRFCCRAGYEKFTSRFLPTRPDRAGALPLGCFMMATVKGRAESGLKITSLWKEGSLAGPVRREPGARGTPG